jgi:hypothetical protein
MRLRVLTVFVAEGAFLMRRKWEIDCSFPKKWYSQGPAEALAGELHYLGALQPVHRKKS